MADVLIGALLSGVAELSHGSTFARRISWKPSALIHLKVVRVRIQLAISSRPSQPAFPD